MGLSPNHAFSSKNGNNYYIIDKHVFHSRHNVIIGIFYRSPNSALNTFNDSLEKLLNVIQKEKKYAYILGDFNVNTISEFTGTTPQCQQFTNIFLAHYYRNSYITHTFTYTSFRKLT